jgi:hypothetical protein
VCGFPSLEEFTKSNPTPANILELAWSIVTKYVTPTNKLKTVHKSKSDDPLATGNNSDSKADSEAPTASESPSSSPESDHKDIIHENMI